MAANPQTVLADVWFPPKLKPIIRQKARYKVLRGGRGGGKSWAVARALLLMGLQRKIRVLCARETQRSIRESVHKLLVDQIAQMGLAQFYRVQQVQITGVNGTEFIFCGLSDQTAATIKSYEKVAICWVEEAHTVSEYSWQILLPTLFRREDCEVWITFNPELDTDPTWKMFIEKPPPNTISIELNWSDNPWFPAELNERRVHDQATLKDFEYAWIWEGKCKPAVTGAIYADDLARMFTEGRVTDVPVDASKPLYGVFDLGWNDKTAIIVCQRNVSSLRINDYLEDSHRRPDHYSQWLRLRDVQVCELFLPHDGAHDHLTGQSAQRDFEDLKWMVTVLPPQNAEDGIRATRQAFPSIYIDRRCERLVECLKRYRRTIPVTTGEPSKPMHDQYSHGADALRYAVLAAPQMDRGNPQGGGPKLPPMNWPKGM